MAKSSLLIPRKWTKQPQQAVGLRSEYLDGLLACYPNAPQYGIGADIGPSAFTGTLIGDATYAPHALLGNALKLDGSGDALRKSDPFYSDTYTIATSFVASFLDANVRSVIIKRNINGAIGSNEFALVAANDRIRFVLWNASDTTNILAYDTTINTGDLYRVVVTIPEGTDGTAQMWINGALVSSITKTINIQNTTSDLELGANSGGFATRWWNGYIGPTTFWDHVRADAQELSANPWQIFKRKPQTLYFDVGGVSHALTPTSVESATEVSSPALGQTHALTATSVESASEVSAPALTQAHVLTAVSVESASEVSAPELGLTHVLTATSVESTTELTAPVIGQAHALSPNSVESATEVTAPVLTENAAGVHNLTATSVESATEVTAPVLGQVHTIAPSSVESATELSAPTLAQVHVLFPNSVESVSEVSAPTLTTGFALTPVSVESATEVTAPTLAQVHVLYPASVESASEVSAPAIGQVHALAAVSVESATELSSPVLAIAGAASLAKFSFTAVLPETIITTALPRTVIISAIPSTILSVAV